jgi:hypothetical protein
MLSLSSNQSSGVVGGDMRVKESEASAFLASRISNNSSYHHTVEYLDTWRLTPR